MRTKLGFTIIELLTVIAIIGIVSSISLPIYKNLMPTMDLTAVTRDTASDLRYAQQMAVTEQIIYSVSFTTSTNKYSILKGYPTSTVVKIKSLDKGIKFKSITGFTSSTIQFISTGAALQTGDISLVNSQNKSSTIEIKPSGYVKIQ